MSRRTSEANKAIAQAWEQEKQRVSEGNGTRDWTQEQQKDILERGKAYDDNGKAFEGQHMRSAEMHPECQGDPNNIQFLTREEHLAAHDGNWKSPTNWYYDPVTKTKTDFGDGPIIPCKEIELSDPVCVPEMPQADEEPAEEKTEAKEEPVQKPIEDKTSKQTAAHSGDSASKIPQPIPVKKASGGGIFSKLKRGTKNVLGFFRRHKGEIFTTVAVAAVAIGGAVIKAYEDSNGNGSGNGGFSNSSGSSSSGGYSSSDDYDYSSSYEDADSYDSTSSDDYSEDTDRDYPSERSSPREHNVSEYTRHQNGKEVHVNPYKRGGKKDGD